VGETQNQPFQLSFNPSLRVAFQGSRVTSDGGLVLVRELDERLGLSDLIARHSTDSRAKNTQLPMADLLRQSLYSRMAGYEDVNDAERLAQDPTFRLIGSEKIWERGDAILFWSLDRFTREGTLPTLQYLQRLDSYFVTRRSECPSEREPSESLSHLISQMTQNCR
jgi:hypothetical protein